MSVVLVYQTSFWAEELLHRTHTCLVATLAETQFLRCVVLIKHIDPKSPWRLLSIHLSIRELRKTTTRSNNCNAYVRCPEDAPDAPNCRKELILAFQLSRKSQKVCWNGHLVRVPLNSLCYVRRNHDAGRSRLAAVVYRCFKALNHTAGCVLCFFYLCVFWGGPTIPHGVFFTPRTSVQRNMFVRTCRTGVLGAYYALVAREHLRLWDTHGSALDGQALFSRYRTRALGQLVRINQCLELLVATCYYSGDFLSALDGRHIEIRNTEHRTQNTEHRTQNQSAGSAACVSSQ